MDRDGWHRTDVLERILRRTRRAGSVVEHGHVHARNANGAVQGRTNNSVGSVPSPGGPYHIAIDSGTGSYAGATGSCAVEEHLVMVQFGEQNHSGPFTCTLTLPAPDQKTTPLALGS